MEIIRLDIKTRGVEQIESRNILLYMNLEGALKITRSDHTSELKPNDILLVNSRTPHQTECRDGMYIRCEINLNQTKELLPGKRLRFLCDSTAEQNDNYELLRGHIKALLLSCLEPDELRSVRVAQESFGLIGFLAANFLISQVEENSGAEPSRDEAVSADMIDYIEQNYQDELSLKQISQHFHMTPQYFSKYFKQNVGANYLKYLNSIRLEQAVELLVNTDMQILRIAISSGFPTSESFYRTFQTVYQTTPAEFRAARRREREQSEQTRNAVWKKALTVLGPQSPENEAESVTVEIGRGQVTPADAAWSKLLNLYHFNVLRDSDVREQLKMIQEAIRFEYARIAMDAPTEGDFFYEEEQALDYLRTLGLKLWLVIELDGGSDPDRMEAKLNGMLSHMANRFSIKGIRSWRYEMVCKPDLWNEPERCWRLYERFSALLRRFGCCELIGFGLPLGDMELIRRFYRLRPADTPLPMRTFQAEPFLRLDTGEGTATSRSTDSSYLKNRIIAIRRAIPEFQTGEIPLYITSWNNTGSKRNLLNDSCFRGAEIMKNMIDAVGYVRAIAPRMPLDLLDRAARTGKMLFGGDGLVTRSGIGKPAFYSLWFLSRNGSAMLAKSSNVISFADGNNMQIVCHNCKRLSYRYYLDEDKLELGRYDEYFDDLEPIKFTFRLKDVPDGDYIVKIRTVSRQCGSVQDIMRNMVDRSNIYLHPHDIEYLQQLSVPNLRLLKITVTGGEAELNIELPANAFAHLHIIYQF